MIELVSLTLFIKELSEKIKSDNSVFASGQNKRSFKTEVKDTFRKFIEENFECKNNCEVIDFLKNESIDRESHHSARTFLCFKNESLVGYFTLTFKQLDISNL